jgi:hypothetical protein
LGEAACYGSLDCLREIERRHVADCDRCRRLYGGYRLTDRLLAAPWREVNLAPAAVRTPSRWAPLAGFLGNLNARTLAPALALAAVIVLVGAAVALPRLIPGPAAATHSPVAYGTPTNTPSGNPTKTAWPSASGRTVQSPGGAQGSGVVGPGSSPSTGPGSTAPGGGSGTARTLAIAKIGGSPIAWSPDGAHLLSWTQGRQLQIRDTAGRLTGTAAADAAVWVSSSTIAVATRYQAPATATGTFVRGSYGPGHRGSQPGNTAPTRGGGEIVSLINLGGHVTATLPGRYNFWGGVVNGMLVGSGTGELTIASLDGPGSWHFVLWNGSLSGVQNGLPMAFSRDGSRLAVLRPGFSSGGTVSGSLEIRSVPSLGVAASFPRLNLRAVAGSLGSDYGFDAAFSPDARSLLVSGTLVDLGNGSSLATGKGGWLPDGTLVTSSGSGLVRWHGRAGSPDSRFPGPGTVETASHGELIYFYSNGRPALLLDTTGAIYSLSMSGVRTVSGLLISPSGRSIAFDGRATDGSSITAVATLP